MLQRHQAGAQAGVGAHGGEKAVRRRCGVRELTQPDVHLALGRRCPTGFGDGRSCGVLTDG
jgi:hypothetical protein